MQNSDFKFPKYVTGIKDLYGEWLEGGYDFQTQAPGWTRYTVCHGIREFRGSDLTGNVPQTGVFQSDPLTLWEYPNGYKIKATFRQSNREVDVNLSIIINWYDKDDVAIGDISNVVSGYFSSATWYWRRYGNIQSDDFRIVVYFNTQYYPTANPPADTANNGIGLFMFCGFESYGFDLNAGNWTTKGVDTGEVAGMPQYLAMYNLDAFNTYLHQHGDSFEGDVFTDEEFPGEPAGGEDTSGTGGGEGNYDDTSDPIDFPDLPTGGALTSGMIKGFVMNSGNLVGLQQKLWDMNFFDIATQFQKLVNQPLDCFISLHCLPFAPPEGTTPQNIKLGGFDTTIQANIITAQYVAVDAGTIDVHEFWGSALDYAPYTQVELWVPFVGYRNIKIEDIQNVTLAMKYHVDIMTGDCVAFLKCGQSVMYAWSGNCRSSIPVTSQSNDLLFKSITAAGAIGAGIATGNSASAAAGVISGAANVATAKNHVQRSGDLGGSAGLMSEFVPYLIFHRPKQSLAKEYNKFKGYPANITYSLGNLKGYTEVEHINLSVQGATDTELEEIKRLLQEGVII